MELERALQANHSENMRIVAAFVDEESAERVQEELLRHLAEILQRADRFACASFGRRFESEEEFQDWKAREWDPVADERCALEVKMTENGHIYVAGNYGLIFDDWSREDVGIALHGATVAVRTYTAGYGIEYLDQWLSERGGDVDVEVEGCRYDFVPLETALEQIQAAGDTKRPDGVRTEDGNNDSAHPSRSSAASPQEDLL